jgi:hypothetical protein
MPTPAGSLLDGYLFKTQPFVHQRAALEKGAGKWFFAYFMDQGTGKTKVIWDNAAFLYLRQIITGVLILAPNDVHAQWIDEQMPLHLPDYIPRRAAVWDATGHKAKRLVHELISHPLPNRLTILAMNHDAMATIKGVKIAQAFAKCYKTLLAVDESHNYKTPGAARTKALQHRVRPLCPVVRLATGTPMDKPFDMYSQLRLMHEKILGSDSFLTFKHHYAEFTTEFAHRMDKKKNKMVLQEYETLVGYKNLDELQERMAPYVYICRKEDCTDLPPKLYAVRRSHLNLAQQTLYTAIKEEGIALLELVEGSRDEEPPGRALSKFLGTLNIGELDDEELVQRLTESKGRMTIKIKLVLSLRLRQIVGGFATDDERRVYPIGEFATLPRVKSVLTLIEGAAGKVLIWAQFKAELVALKEFLAAAGFECALVYGATPKAERARAIANFKDPNHALRILIAHPKTVGTGQNFQVAQTEIFYSNGTSSIERTQCEDRCHRIGQIGTVSIYDLQSAPVCKSNREDLFKKRDISAGILSMNAEQLKEYF